MSTNAENVQPQSVDEFSYLETGGFSSENFKIEVRNLPKYYGISEFRKLLFTKLALKPIKIKPPHHRSKWIYVSFADDEERRKAVETLEGFKWKGSVLNCEIAKPAPDPLFKKRKMDAENEESRNGKKTDTRTQEERLKDNAIPYWNIPYNEQVEIKEKTVKDMLLKLGNELWKNNRDLRDYITSQREKHDGLICEYAPIKTSDKVEGYRNKCEFTIGIDRETDLPTVGFRLGTYVSGSTGVAPVENLCHISSEMKRTVKLIEDFIRSGDLKVYSPEDHSGHWKQLTVRQSFHDNGLMLILSMHIQTMNLEEIKTIKNNLIEYVKKNKNDLIIQSIYFITLNKRGSADETELEHLDGETHIYDYIHGLKFRISPQAFFQINTKAAEILYQSAIDMSQPHKECTVFDICCGTGTIGLCFSKYCDQVLGLELVPEAVADAKENATFNECVNAEFFTGRVENILYSVCSKTKNKHNIAIIDPPRSGLHVRALVQLRKMESVDRLVYISCDPAAAMKNFVDLGRAASKTMHGNPFVPTRAVAVDMFPHTKHVEMVILFERVKENKQETTSIKEEKPPEEEKEDVVIVKAENNIDE